MMFQLMLAAAVGLGGLAVAKGSPPADAAVIAALPSSDAVRADVTIVKALMSARAEPTKGRPTVVGQWACSVYYTEGAPPRQRVHIVYLESPVGK